MKLNIRIVTPVLIRDGKEYNWFEFFKRGSVMNLIDIDATFSRADLKEIKEFNSLIGKYAKTKEYTIKSGHANTSDLARIQESINQLYERLDKEGRLVKILPEIAVGDERVLFNKTPSVFVPIHSRSGGNTGATVYIPGSSIKGMFETALSYSFSKRTHGGRIDPMMTIKNARGDLLYKLTSFTQFSDFLPVGKIKLKLYLMKRGVRGRELTNNGIFISDGEFAGDFSIRRDGLLTVSKNSNNFGSNMKAVFGDFRESKNDKDIEVLESAIVDHMLLSSEQFLSEVNQKFINSDRGIRLETCNGTIGGFRGQLLINAERTRDTVPKTYWYIESDGAKKLPGQIQITKGRN